MTTPMILVGLASVVLGAGDSRDAEAKSNLMALKTAARSVFLEHGSYATNYIEREFAPAACSDGTRPKVPVGTGLVAGCDFIYRLEVVASGKSETFTGRAVGVGEKTKGRRFKITPDGVPEPDAELPTQDFAGDGQELDDACLSGGSETFLCQDGTSYVVSHESDSSPDVWVGKWGKSGDVISIRLVRHIFGKPTGKEVPNGSDNRVFERYVLTVEPTRSEEVLLVSDFRTATPNVGGQGTCLTRKPFSGTCRDPSVIETSPPGRFPFASLRLVTEQDVRGLSGDDLDVMRNEIFARRGFTFTTPKWLEHFKAQSWYRPLARDADSLLTPIEKKNVEFLKARKCFDRSHRFDAISPRGATCNSSEGEDGTKTW